MPKTKKRADGRYARQVYLGRNGDGRRQYKTVYGSSAKEAEDKALGIRLQLKKGIDVSAGQDTFGEWAAYWLSTKKGGVSDRHYQGLAGKVSLLSEWIGTQPIGRIRPADIQTIIQDLANCNPKTGRPTAKKTLQDIRSVASQIFSAAIENRVMDYNPAQYVRIPVKAPQEKRRALTPEEQQWIIDTPHRAQRAAMIMMYAGLRRGELIPLQWNDVDLAQGTISVTKSVEIIGGHPKIKAGGKTAGSCRVIDIPNRLVQFLTQEKSDAGPFDLVCPSVKGTMLSESGFRRMWESYLSDLNFKYGNRLDKTGKLATSKCNPHGIERTIPPITAHWLRYTFATMLYLAGVDVLTARDQLGHSDIKTTLSIYTHLDKQYKRRSMDKLNAYLDDTHGATG